MRQAFAGLALAAVFIAGCSAVLPSADGLDGPTTNITVAAGTDDLTTVGVPFVDGHPVVDTVGVAIYAIGNPASEVALSFSVADGLYSYDPDGLVDTIDFEFGGSVDVALPAGQDYGFETTGADIDTTWLAYGQSTAYVDFTTTTVRLALQTMIDGATLDTIAPTSAVDPGQSIDLHLAVGAPGGYTAPVADYAVTYAILPDDGTVGAMSKVGTRAVTTASRTRASQPGTAPSAARRARSHVLRSATSPPRRRASQTAAGSTGPPRASVPAEPPSSRKIPKSQPFGTHRARDREAPRPMSTQPSSTTHRVGIALSGGGARCFAHIGALAALEEEGLHPCAIAANSSAAIVGAFYAAGNDAGAVEAIVRAIDFKGFLDPGGSGGLIEHDVIERALERHAPETFEELAVPLAVPVVDIERAELLIYSSGPLRRPVCASNAFPGLFVPVSFDGRHLLDGGIINNFPIDVARAMTQRPIIAIDVQPPHTGSLDLDPKEPDNVVERAASLFQRGGPSVVEILMRAYAITQARLLDVLIAAHPPDVVLRPSFPDDLELQSFDRLDDAIAIGYACVKEAAAAGRFEAIRSGNAD